VPPALPAGLLHRVEADEVSLGIQDVGDEAVFADGLFSGLETAAILDGAIGHGGAIRAGEIDDGAAHAGVLAFHLHEGSRGTGALRVHGECPQLNSRSGQALEGDIERLFVKRFGAIHVLNVDLEPPYWISIGTHDYLNSAAVWILAVRRNDNVRKRDPEPAESESRKREAHPSQAVVVSDRVQGRFFELTLFLFLARQRGEGSMEKEKSRIKGPVSGGGSEEGWWGPWSLAFNECEGGLVFLPGMS